MPPIADFRWEEGYRLASEGACWCGLAFDKSFNTVHVHDLSGAAAIPSINCKVCPHTHIAACNFLCHVRREVLHSPIEKFEK